jgi:hypothetical protein
MRTALAALLILATAAAAAPPPTTQSLEQRMIELAPMLSIDDPQTKSLDVQMVMNTGTTQMLFRGLYEGPDRHAIYISDPRDGTPLCIVVDDRIIIYDPIEGVLRVAENGTASLELKAQDDELHFNFGFDRKSQKSWLIAIDLASIVRGGQGSAVEDLGSGIYGLRQRGSEEASQLYAIIDPRRTCPYLRVELIRDGKPAITIDPLTRNEPIDQTAFSIPSNQKLAEHIPIEPGMANGILAVARGPQVFAQILLARIAPDDHVLRANLDRNWPIRVDWEKVRKNDARFAPILRELFPLATAAPSGSGASTKPAAVSNDPAAPSAQ